MPVALFALTSPVTKPVKVTVTEAFPTIAPAPRVVITNDVAEGAAANPATLWELMATLGSGQPRAKKYHGKKRVIFPPDGIVPPRLGVNEKVAALPGYWATLWLLRMEKLSWDTRLPHERWCSSRYFPVGQGEQLA